MFLRVGLIVFLGFIAITAIPGGIILILSPDGWALGTTIGILNFTPFNSFLIPGFILLLFVGGSSFAAVVQLINNTANAKRFAFAAGVILFGWMTGVLLLIQASSWLLVLYFVAAVCILFLALRMKRLFIKNEMQQRRN